MAKSQLPSALERRHLVERELPAEQALRLAEVYLNEGRAWEAIDFLAKANAQEKLAALQEEAIAQGDAFLLRELSRTLRVAPGPDSWRRLAEAAQAAGKDRYAAEAKRQADSAEG